jgi:hypothetical protein
MKCTGYKQWEDLTDITGDNTAEGDEQVAKTGKLSWDLESPLVTEITPNTGKDNMQVAITDLAGVSFVRGATVRLKRNGQGDIVASNVVFVSPMKITCTFDLGQKAVGDWNVVVTNPADESNPGTLTNGFTITAP